MAAHGRAWPRLAAPGRARPRPAALGVSDLRVHTSIAVTAVALTPTSAAHTLSVAASSPRLGSAIATSPPVRWRTQASVPPQVTSTSRKPLSIALEEVAVEKIVAVELPDEPEEIDEEMVLLDSTSGDTDTEGA